MGTIKTTDELHVSLPTARSQVAAVEIAAKAGKRYFGTEDIDIEIQYAAVSEWVTDGVVAPEPRAYNVELVVRRRGG
jgi:hypothetical protein